MAALSAVVGKDFFSCTSIMSVASELRPNHILIALNELFWGEDVPHFRDVPATYESPWFYTALIDGGYKKEVAARFREIAKDLEQREHEE